MRLVRDPEDDRRALVNRRKHDHYLQRRSEDLLRKFHVQTECGTDGMHWNECEMLAQLLGIDPDLYLR